MHVQAQLFPNRLDSEGVWGPGGLARPQHQGLALPPVQQGLVTPQGTHSSRFPVPLTLGTDCPLRSSSDLREIPRSSQDGVLRTEGPRTLPGGST